MSSVMNILAKCWFKFYDENGEPCIVLLDDIVAVYTNSDSTCVVETIHAEYFCGDTTTNVINFLSSYFNYS